MKIVKFENGKYAVRKWFLWYSYADADDFERWGWWFSWQKSHAYIDDLNKAKKHYELILSAKGHGKVIDT
mgnify:CR=1 FL=1|tara:strand:+ start:1646 stop:1855 length:210 start_codon:yes stop_codon:yes gene_type:complete